MCPEILFGYPELKGKSLYANELDRVYLVVERKRSSQYNTQHGLIHTTKAHLFRLVPVGFILFVVGLGAGALGRGASAGAWTVLVLGPPFCSSWPPRDLRPRPPLLLPLSDIMR